MNRHDKVLPWVLGTVYAALMSVGIYGKVWESKQKPFEIGDAVVQSIEPYRHHNELTSGSSGVYVSVDKEPRRIDFEFGEWESSIRPGYRVDITAKREFDLFGTVDEQLDGLEIRVSKPRQ